MLANSLPNTIQGGHVNTYNDPTSNTFDNYGVKVYLRYGNSVAFFERFDIPIAPYAQGPQNSIYVSTSNASKLNSYVPPSFPAQIAAFATWQKFTAKYADILSSGLWNFPKGNNIPSELLLPFGEFARKNGMEAVAPLFGVISNVGVGGLENVLTLYVMFAMGQPVTSEFLNSSLFVPANLSNSVLYDRAYNLLRDDVLLKSKVTASQRSNNGVELIVRRSNGSKMLVKAKRLLFTPPPSIANLAPFGLSSNERATLSTFTGTWSFTSVARIPCIPANTSVYYYAPAADSTNYLGIRNWPWTLSLVPSPDIPAGEHLFEVEFAQNSSISEKDARKTIKEAVQNLTASGTSELGKNCGVEFVAFSNHNSILWRQSVSELRSGIVQDVYALQGRHSTWYTGGLWSEDYTGNVWAFTDTVLPRLLASLGR